MCGIEYQGEPIEGFDLYQYPASTWIVFTAKGSISEGVLGQTWKRIYGEFMPCSEYRQVDLPTIEQYIDWNEAENHCHVDIFIPVKK